MGARGPIIYLRGVPCTKECYLAWGEAEAGRNISEDSQVVAQGPTGAAAAPGHPSVSLPPCVLLAQVLERGLGADLKQIGEMFFGMYAKFEIELAKEEFPNFSNEVMEVQ